MRKGYTSSTATSLSTEWHTEGREDCAHMKCIAQVKGIVKFLAGHIGHAQGQMVCVEQRIALFAGSVRLPKAGTGR